MIVHIVVQHFPRQSINESESEEPFKGVLETIEMEELSGQDPGEPLKEIPIQGEPDNKKDQDKQRKLQPKKIMTQSRI